MLTDIRQWFKKEKLESIQITPDLNEIRKRARILFIDDEDVPQIKILKAEGFSIEHWKDIKKNLNRIESGDYDIIFLDIAGVGERYSREGAIGILKDIKKCNPAVIVIAFSGQKFDIEQTKFFKLADDVLKKDAGPVEIKTKIEEFLKEKFSVTFYWVKIKDFLKAQGISESKINKAEKILYKSISKKDNKLFIDWVKKMLTDETSIKTLTTLSLKLIEIITK